MSLSSFSRPALVTEEDQCELFEKYRVFVGRGPYAYLKPRITDDTKELPVFISPIMSFWAFPKDYPPNKPILAKLIEERESYSIGFSKGGKNSDIDRLLKEFFGFANKEGEYAVGENLLVKINLNSSRRDILKAIDKLLGVYKGRGDEANDKKQLFKYWKDYLIVYDLKTQDQKPTFNKIAKIMYNAYPEHLRPSFDSGDSAKTCRRYFNRAKEIINGGYKEFI